MPKCHGAVGRRSIRDSLGKPFRCEWRHAIRVSGMREPFFSYGFPAEPWAESIPYPKNKEEERQEQSSHLARGAAIAGRGE